MMSLQNDEWCEDVDETDSVMMLIEMMSCSFAKLNLPLYCTGGMIEECID